MDLVSFMLSMIGMGQRRADQVAQRRSVATQLNTEMEQLIWRAENIIRLKKPIISRRFQIFEEIDPTTGAQCLRAFERFEEDLQLGQGAVTKNGEAIEAGSAVVSLAKWDELVAALFRQKAAVEVGVEQLRDAIAEMERILIHAEDLSGATEVDSPPERS